MNSSKNIIPKIVIKLSKDELKTIFDYFQISYNDLKILNKELLQKKKYLNKMKYISYAINNNLIKKFKTNFSTFLENLIFNSAEYKKNIYKIYNLKKKDIIDTINDKIDLFFKQQFNNKLTIQKILSLINYQYITLKFFKIYIFPLIKKDQIYSEILIKNHTTNIAVNQYIKKLIDQIDLQKLPTVKHIPPKNYSSLITDKDKVIYDFLKEFSKFITIQTQIYILNGENVHNKFDTLTYGSFTCFNLNSSIDYNDIDMYHTNPLIFLTCLLLLFYFIINTDQISILKNPYILGYLSLKYKDEHFLDCIFLDKYTVKNIPFSIINNIKFVHPIIQMLNNFRMMSNIRRLDNISNNKENTVKKFASLLSYGNEIYLNFDFKNIMQHSNVNYVVKQIDEYILIDLKKTFYNDEKYKNLSNNNYLFEYILIPLLGVEDFLNFINKPNFLISKQYFSLFNEIIVEVYNKKNYLPSKDMQNKLIIQESDIKKYQNRFNKNLKQIDHILNKNNIIIISNFTTDLYLINNINEQEIVTEIKLSLLSLRTILSSFVLYLILKNKQKDIIVFYLEQLLKFNINPNIMKEFEYNYQKNKIEIFSKVKLKGKHTSLNISELKFNEIFFYHPQLKDYYNYDEIINLISYNS